MNLSYELCQRLEAILFKIGKMSTLKKCAPISEKEEEFCKLRDFLSSVKEDRGRGYWFMNEIECFEHWLLMHNITEELKEKTDVYLKVLKLSLMKYMIIFRLIVRGGLGT